MKVIQKLLTFRKYPWKNTYYQKSCNRVTNDFSYSYTIYQWLVVKNNRFMIRKPYKIYKSLVTWLHENGIHALFCAAKKIIVKKLLTFWSAPQ